MDETRRKTLRAVATYVGASVLGGFTASVGEKTFNTIYKEKDVGEAEKEALGVFFGRCDEVPSVYAGEGNLLGSVAGLNGISVNLDYSAAQFTNYIVKALNPIRNVVADNSDDAFIYDPRRNSIFLGGPSANKITSKLLGYKEVEVLQEGKPAVMVTVDLNNRVTRWGQLYGETGYGIYNGKQEVAIRYSTRTQKEVARPVYKMLDKQTGNLFSPIIENGYLMSEWLTIVRFKDGGTYKVVIGGMHGYSTAAFCKNITMNIENLQKVVGAFEQYQVIVPVMLSHRRNLVGGHDTTGELDWPNAQCHQIIV